jgi:hypothetical protein
MRRQGSTCWEPEDISIPYEINDGKIKATFLGDAKEVRGMLQTLEMAHMRYNVVSLMDAKFSPDSPESLDGEATK